jgi:hypothetical protein
MTDINNLQPSDYVEEIDLPWSMTGKLEDEEWLGQSLKKAKIGNEWVPLPCSDPERMLRQGWISKDEDLFVLTQKAKIRLFEYFGVKTKSDIYS